MNRKKILTAVAVIAIIIMVLWFNPYLLFGLPILLLVIVWRFVKKKDENKTQLGKMSFAAVNAEYGEPDDIIVVDATRGNEVSGCILVYKSPRLLVVGGEPVRIDDITDVTTVNTATPYTVGQYQLVLTTRRADIQYLRMNVGMDGGLARDIATQVIDAIKSL